MIQAGSWDDLRHGILARITSKIQISMKIGISGKGGVGKTTLCALLAQEAAQQSYRVLTVDADPNPTLAATLGLSQEPAPLLQLRALMEERLGSLEGFFRLNPKVDDIPERFAVEKDGIQLLVMGSVQRGAEGCACPQNIVLKRLLEHIVWERDELVLVDFEAGLEPLGRATAEGFDALVIVLEPDARSLTTASRIYRLARDIRLKRLYAVANQIREPADVEYIRAQLPRELALLGTVSYSEALRRSGLAQGTPVDPVIRREIQAVLKRLEDSLEPSVLG